MNNWRNLSLFLLILARAKLRNHRLLLWLLKLKVTVTDFLTSPSGNRYSRQKKSSAFPSKRVRVKQIGFHVVRRTKSAPTLGYVENYQPPSPKKVIMDVTFDEVAPCYDFFEYVYESHAARIRIDAIELKRSICVRALALRTVQLGAMAVLFNNIKPSPTSAIELSPETSEGGVGESGKFETNIREHEPLLAIDQSKKVSRPFTS